MQWHKKAFSLLCCLIITWNTLAQVVYEPTYHTVYPYLSRLAQKGVIELDDVVLPLSKDYIYQKLDELSKNITALTPLEREELAFYLKEYTLWWRKDPKSGFEGEYKSLFKTKIGDRFRWLAYQDDNFTVNVQPIVGQQFQSVDGNPLSQFTYGVWGYGYIGKYIGFSLDFKANKLKGLYEGYDYLQEFSPQTGVIGVRSGSIYDFNETNVNITGKWKWGSATIGKNYMPIGYGVSNKIILSQKAPSFPQIRLDISPVKWLSVNYAHLWLNSKVIDSTKMYTTSIPGRLQYQDRAKYMAINSLTFRPFKGASFMMGQSSVYNDQIQLVYLIPINLFSAMNHYLGELDGNNTLSNSQLFFQLSSRNHIKKTHLYFNMFIDELRVSGTDSSKMARNHTAYMVGASVADFPLKNMTITAEYTKIQPFAYVHFIPAQTYANNNYNLGSWLGPNADDFFIRLHYRVLRGLEFQVQYEYIRKGTVGGGIEQSSNKPIYPFLWGDVKTFSNLNIELSYEFIHDLFVFGKYATSTIRTEVDNKEFQQQTSSFGIKYGF